MAKILGVEGMSPQDIQDAVSRGGKFVYFPYVISVVVMTFRRNSDIYFVRAGESALAKGLPHLLTSLFLGWWGVPWGFLYTPMALYTAFRGGKDVTAQIMQSLPRVPVPSGMPGFDLGVPENPWAQR